MTIQGISFKAVWRDIMLNHFKLAVTLLFIAWLVMVTAITGF